MKRFAFFRSVLAILLCLTMVLSFVPMQAMAAESKPVALAYDCAKDGHKYQAGEFRATCEQYPLTRYTCSVCGDSYDVYADELYSDWQAEKPDVDDSLIQTKKQYRTSQYETITSFNTAVAGYEQIGSQWSKNDTRSVMYVASWPAGFDTLNSLYSQYNKASMKVTASESSNRKTEIDSDEIVGYLYYHWCYEGYPYTVAEKEGLFDRFHAYYSTKSPSEADSYDISDNSYRFDDATACSDSNWYFCVPVYQQTYTTYRMEYIYGTWGNFSEWSDTEATPSEIVKVGTRTVYRYVNAPMADHSYNTVTNPASCTAVGETTYTCTVCEHSYTEELPMVPHKFVNGKCSVCGNKEPAYYLVGYINGADYGCEGDYENMGTYKFVDGKLVATFEQNSYVFIKTEGNAAWYMAESYTEEDTVTLKNTNTGVGEKLFVPGGVELTFTLTTGEDDTLVLSYVGGTCTHRYEKTVVNEPTCTEEGLASVLCTKCGDSKTEVLEALDHDYRRGVCKGCGLKDDAYVTPNYYLVGYINGVDYGSQDDYENRGEFRFEEGKLVINCTQDSYVFVKTEGNTAWYMTMEYCTDNTAVLYDTRDGSYEKMFIPAYMEVTFTLVETADNTLTLSYAAVPCKHIYDDTVLVEETCEEDGIMLRTCRICTATAEKPIATNGHNYDVEVVAPGCITGGYTQHTCVRCGHSYQDEEVEAAGHDYETEVVEEPGCLTPGTMAYTCKVCGNSYKGKIEATNHNYKAEVIKPTCTDKGYTIYRCSGCGDSYIEDYVDATGHHYKGVTTVPPTCNTDGLMTYTCSGCGDAYIQVMKAMGHNYVSQVVKPTCTAKGYTVNECSTCGYIYTDKPVAATGHKYVNGKCSGCGEVQGAGYYLFGWINDANYGCEDDWENMGQYKFVGGKLVTSFKVDSYIGIKTEGNKGWYMTQDYTEATTATFKNTNSGVNQKMKVPGGVELTFTLTVNKDDTLTLSYTTGEAAICEHSYYVVMTTAPTCETAGLKTYTCNHCGVTYTEAMNAHGHSYKAVVAKPTCTAGGFTVHTCLICNESYTDKIVGAAGHSLQAVITTKPGCETAGITTYSCRNCDYNYSTKIEATGHTYKAVVTAPTCTEKGYTTNTCSKCGDAYRDQEVPATGHSYNATVTLEPACTTPGTMTYVCQHCDDTYAEELAAPGHNFVDGACAVCGKSEKCDHEWHEGVCKLCGVVCEHDFVFGVCSICGEIDAFYVPTYYLVGYINGANYGCEEDYENMGEYKFQDDQLILTFEQDSYVFLKAENNTDWYMTKSYVDGSTGTFYNTRTGAAEKMFVPGGEELIFTISVNSGDTIELSYKSTACEHAYEVTAAKAATCTEAGSITHTCPYCGDSYEEEVPATGHKFLNGSCDLCGMADPDYVPPYYLIGFINGANYGCEEDSANMGEYKFVDGKLEATFKQDSYVFLKTENNTGWYMTKSYVDGTTGTFCNTTSGANEKMFVPGNVKVTFTLTVNKDDTLTLTYTTAAAAIKPTLTLKSPTLEFKDMITVNAMFTAENLDSVVEMGMITYTEKVAEWNVETAAHVVPGTTYDAVTGRYIAHSQGIHAKYLGDTVYLACYAKLTDGSYVYSKLAPYSPVQYATSQLKNSTDTKLKQLVAAMLNYGAEAQLFFGHNTGALANASLTAAQKTLPAGYTAGMVSAVPPASTAKQGMFANNSGFAKRYPAISFEGAFCINYFFTPNYTPVNGITLYYWNAADFNAAGVLTTANASGSFKLTGSGTGEYSGDIVGISAKNLSEAVYVAAVYTSGGTTWTSGVLGYSIGSYCSSQASKGADVAALAKATAVYGYHAKLYFG